jgi:hypothetical protein
MAAAEAAIVPLRDDHHAASEPGTWCQRSTANNTWVLHDVLVGSHGELPTGQRTSRDRAIIRT